MNTNLYTKTNKTDTKNNTITENYIKNLKISENFKSNIKYLPRILIHS